MGMNNKLKAIVALAVLGAAGQAHAAIDNGSGGNGELFLAVWDDVSKTSYVKDLGVTMNTFIANGNTAGYSLDYKYGAAAGGVVDANYTAFIAAATAPAGAGGGLANLQWNIGALDTTGGTTAGGQRYLTTSANTLADVGTQSNLNVATGFSNAGQLLSVLNGSYGTHPTLADGSSFTSATVDPASYAGGPSWGSNWAGKAQTFTSSTYGLDSSMGMFYISPSSRTAGNAVTSYQFGDAATGKMGTWAMSSTGALAYSVPSAVPVPAALWLLGSAMVGLVGVARRKVA